MYRPKWIEVSYKRPPFDTPIMVAYKDYKGDEGVCIITLDKTYYEHCVDPVGVIGYDVETTFEFKDITHWAFIITPDQFKR